LSDVLAGAGVLVAAGAGAAAILLPAGRVRSGAMLAALVLFPILILGDQWHTHRIVELRHSTSQIAALAVVGLVAVAALVYVFRRWPVLLPLAIIGVLPFRIPLHSGGDTANLLVPLYLVIAGGVLAVLLRDWSPPLGGGADAGAPRGAERSPIVSTVGEASVTGPARGGAANPPNNGVKYLPYALASFVSIYALQSVYSEDFSKALQEVCFFLVPFSLAYVLLREVRWDRRLLVAVLALIAAEAVAFVAIGTVEYVSRSLFWNDAVITSNEFHTYFRVNSVFWDPNIYGRYLALVLVVVTTAMLYVRDRRRFWLLSGAILVLWVGLAETFSQSSYIALLAGMAVLAALRWSWRWTLAVVVVGLVGAVLVVTLSGGKTLELSNLGKRLNIDTSGRTDLVEGGADLFGQRPLWGYGSGSFQHAYSNHHGSGAPVSISHTEPITVAAEQGLIGLVFYLALITIALWTMAAGLWSYAAVGGAREESENGGDGPRPQDSSLVTGPAAARIAVLATFVALLLHTLAYAGFFQDPITWVLLAIGASLAAAPRAPDRGISAPS
jgi:putative inorganic carbon (HCO3(-)) transporter